MICLLDANVCVQYLRGRNLLVRQLSQLHGLTVPCH